MEHFFDIGANIGQTFDDYLCDHPEFGCVWCFEPSPRHLSALRERILQIDRPIRLCPFALSDCFGVTRFHEKRDPRGDSLYPHLFQGETEVEPAETADIFVATVPISSFILANLGANERVTIKIDAEGSEFKILLDLLAHPFLFPAIAGIHVEWHGTGAANESEQARQLQEDFAAAGLPLHQWLF